MRILPLVWFITLTLSLHPIADRMSSSNQFIEQSPVVKLRGEVDELRLLEENLNAIRWELKLRLRIVNDGNESAILLRQDFQIGAVMLTRSLEDANGSTYLYKHMAWPSVYASPEWQRWRQHADSVAPQPNETWILTPGESMSFDCKATISVEKAGNFDRTNASWAEIKKNVKWVQVQIQPWPANIEPRHDPENLEFGETLRKRWKSFGELQLVRLTSEPMPLTFPQ